jgi:hypothetical protein
MLRCDFYVFFKLCDLSVLTQRRIDQSALVAIFQTGCVFCAYAGRLLCLLCVLCAFFWRGAVRFLGATWPLAATHWLPRTLKDDSLGAHLIMPTRKVTRTGVTFSYPHPYIHAPFFSVRRPGCYGSGFIAATGTASRHRLGGQRSRRRLGSARLSRLSWLF